MPDLPASLALTEIATDAAILSADHRNNYAAIQAAVNALRAALAGGAAGEVLIASDADTVDYGLPPGHEFDYAEFAGDSAPAGTTSGTATSIVSGAAVTYDGLTTVKIAVSFPAMQRGTSWIRGGVFKDGALLEQVFSDEIAGVVPGGTFTVRDTPAAGSHSYSFRAWIDGGASGRIYGSTFGAKIRLSVVKV